MNPTQLDERVERARVALSEHISRTKQTQADVGKQLGISASALSQFLRSLYAGNNQELSARVEELLAREASRGALPQIANSGWRETTIAEAVSGGLIGCHQRRQLGLITGDAGLGKTTTIEHYAAENRSAVVVRVETTCARPHYLLRAIGSTLGLRVPSDLYSAHNTIRDALRGTDRLLVLDEAQRLTAQALECIRDLHDAAKVGVMLCGNQAVQSGVYGTGQAAFAQHFSRLGVHVSVTNEMITPGDVELFVGAHLDPADSASRRYLLELTRRGGFRTMLFTFELALKLHEEGSPFLSTLKAAHAHRGFIQ